MNRFKNNLNYSFQKKKTKLCTILFFNEQKNDVNFCDGDFSPFSILPFSFLLRPLQFVF